MKHRIEVLAGEPVALLALRRLGKQCAMLLKTDGRPRFWRRISSRFDRSYVPRNADLLAYAEPSFAAGRQLLDAVMDLTGRIHTDFRYDAKATTLATPVTEVLEHRHGVCQDFAHLQIGCLRSIGLAARYVSGYLQTPTPAGRERLVGADASHAWVSVFCPAVGWVDFDPTNNMIPAEQHITIAWGRDYDDISPVKGVILGGGSHTMSIAVDVAPAA